MRNLQRPAGRFVTARTMRRLKFEGHANLLFIEHWRAAKNGMKMSFVDMGYLF